MIQKILELLERFVAAQEKMAEANMMLAQDVASPVRVFNPETSTAVQAVKECFEGAEVVSVTPTAATEQQQKSNPVYRTGDWSPFTAPVQGRYDKEKQTRMDALLAERGLPVKGTGAEKHQALLDSEANADVPAAAPTAVTPVEEITSPAEVTVDDVRQLAQKAMAAKMTAPDIQVIFEKHGGSKRLPEIQAEKLAAVFAALTKAMKKEGV